MCVEVFWPKWCPPWVDWLLLVEDIESVRRSTQDGDAECQNKASDDELSQVERCGVDPHFDSCDFFLEDVAKIRNFREVVNECKVRSSNRCQPGAPRHLK